MIDFLKRMFQEWNRDNVPRLAAALAFYTTFSAVPLLILFVSLAGTLFGERAAQGQVADYLGGFVGAQSAQMIQTVLARANEHQINPIDLLLGAGGLVLGTSNVMLQLQTSINDIWGLSPRQNFRLKRTLRRRLLSIALVLAIGLVVLVALVVDTLIPSLEQVFADAVPGGSLSVQLINQLVSLLLVSVLIACTFKYVPDADVAWRDVWIGAAVTALLFAAGKFFIGLYLSSSLVISLYQAGGALIVLLIWIYYTSLIIFVGAEVTNVTVQRRGGTINSATES